MTKRQGLFFAVISSLALGLSACGPEYPNCEQDEDCREGEYCVDGTCQQCRSDADCPTGQQCSSGACEAIAGYCDANTPCPSGQECVNNRCQTPFVAQCDDARPCPAGQNCVDGNCSSIPGYCDATVTCPSGQRCQDNRCVDMCSFESVYFDFDSHSIDADDRAVLQRDYTCSGERNPGALTLTGHADERGTEEYNLVLSENRARAVQRYLRSLGVRVEMRVVGRGEEMATGSDESSWARDRRVDVE